MATYKIKLEDKAAFLDRMKKAETPISDNQITDNKLESYFEVIIDDPKQLENCKTILKQSPKINTLKEMENKKKINRDALKEMIRTELQGALAEKKKMKDEDKKEKLDESILSDPNFIAGVATLLGVGTTLLVPFVSKLKSAKTPEEKAKVKAEMRDAISNSMGK